MKGIGGIKGRPGRFWLAVLSVVLGVAFLSGAFIAHSSVTANTSGVLGVVTGADVYVQPKGSSVADVLLKSTSQQEYLDSAVATQVAVPQSNGSLQVYMGSIILLDHNGNEISSGLAPSVGIPADPNEVETGKLVDGNLPGSISDIALEQKTADRAGLHVGDQAQVIANGTRLEDVTISGIVAYDTDLDGANVVILNGIAARAIYSSSGMIPYVAVKAAEGATPQELRDAVAAAVTDPNADVVLGDDVRAQAASAFNDSLSLVNLALLIIGVAMMAIAGFLVFTIFASAQRTRADEVVTLKAMGATTSDLLKPVVGQGFIVGLIGSVVGLICGYLLSLAAGVVLDHMGLATVITIPWLWLAVSLLAGIAVAMVCAWLGARRVAARKLVDAVKPAPARTGFGIVRLVVGLIFIAAGVAAVVMGHRDSNNAWYVVSGVVAILIGVVLVGPILVALLAWLFSYPMRLFSRLSAVLAKANLVHGPRRAANVAGVFIIAMALASATLILSASANADSSSILDKEVNADLILTPTTTPGSIPDQVVAQVRQIPNVQVYTFGQAPMRMNDDQDARIMFGPSETFTALSGETIVEGSADDFANGVAVTKAFADSHNLAIGDSINFTIAQTTPYEVNVTLPVALIIDSDLYKDMMVPYSWLIQQVPGHTRAQLMPVTIMFASASDPSLVDSIHDPVVAAVEVYKTISVNWKDDFVSATDSGNQARILVYAIVILCVIFAILALVNTSDRASHERIREIGVLRAVGASRGQIRNTIIFESVLICIAGSLVGIATGVVLAYVGRAVLPLGITNLTFPWIWLVGLFVLSILVGLIAPIGPAGRASRTPPAEVLV